MQWITISAEDLNDYQVAAYINAARTAALEAGQADPFDVVMPDIVNSVRDEVRACPRNRVSATPLSVPPSLRSQTIYLIIEAMQGRLPGFALDDGIKTLVKDAKERLKRISLCEMPIDQPDDPLAVDDVQRGGLVETVQAGNSGNSREELNRL